MHSLSIVALCLISSGQALSANLAAAARDQPSQTVSLTEPSPTSTNPQVVAAYNTYSQKCGSDLNTATQAALQTYENMTSQTGVSITDQTFLSWASTGYPDYMQASQDCQKADIAYQDVLDAARSSAAPSSTPAPASSSSPASSATPAQPSSSGGAPVVSTSSTPTSSSTQSSQSAKPDGAVTYGPSWVLGVAGLLIFFAQ
ncbi:hypothetical protein B0H10DRAFT_1978611 [Mycena sp. CBHHK59/15]|nr:hypothetical protein B0H10DRAFT_1978611 [Mycena sp. CBHHK59/15]